MGMILGHILTMNPLTTIVRPTYSVYKRSAWEVLMTRYSDDELRRLQQEAVETAHQSENDSEWASVLSAIEKLENNHPCLRSHKFVAERIGNLFVTIVGDSGRAIPADCMEKIAQLVLLFDKPLVAAEVLKAMLKNLDDPIEGLQNAIRMAEVTMNAKFTAHVRRF